MNTVCSYIVLVVMSGKDVTPSQPVTLADGETSNNVNFTVKGDVVTPDGITGVETLHATSLQIYPNPFTDAVHITGVVETLHATSLQVVNAAGVTVHTQKLASPDETVNLAHLPSGVYLLMLDNGTQKVVMRMIKN